MTRMSSVLDKWIHGFLPATPESLALSRIFFAGFILFGGLPTFSWIAAAPPGFFAPPPLSIAGLFGDFPPAGFLAALDAVILASCICMLVGFRTRTASLAFSIAWILGSSFGFSFGKIDHIIFIIITPAIMAFSNWGAAYSVDERLGGRRTRTVEAWPLSLLALLIGFGFLTAGLPKAIHWIDFDLSTQGARGWLVAGWYDQQRIHMLAPLFMEIASPLIWEGMDYAAVAFEIGFFLSLLNRGVFRGFLYLAVFFHLANLMILNIGFTVLLPVYFLFLPWERLGPAGPRPIWKAAGMIGSPRAGVVLALAFLPLFFLRDSLSPDIAAYWFTHASLLSGWIGFRHYEIVSDTIMTLAAAALAVWLAGRHQRGFASVPKSLPAGGCIIFFDGVCNLCNGYVDFLISRDSKREFRFASLQSRHGEAILEPMRKPGRGSLDTMMLLDSDGGLYERSDAVLQALTRLGGAYGLLRVFLLVPRSFRDVAYRIMARMRYALFGKRNTCRVPTLHEKSVFLD